MTEPNSETTADEPPLERRPGSDPSGAALASLIDGIDGVVFELDCATGSFTYVSGAAGSLLGYPPDRWTDGPALWPRLVPDEAERENVRRAREVAVRERTRQRHQFRARRADGTDVWLRESVSAVDTPGGPRLRGVLVEMPDAADGGSDQRQILLRANQELEERVAERTEQLSRRTEELEAVFRALPDLFFRLDMEGRVVDFRAGTRDRLLLPPEQFLGRDLPSLLEQLMPPEAGGVVRSRLLDVARTGEMAVFEYTLPLEGEALDFEARVVRLDSDSLVAVVREITDRKRAEEELRRREEHFRRLIETSHDLIQTLDPSGRIVYTGPSVERILGYTPEEISGKGADDFIHPDDHALVQEKVAEALTNPGHLIYLQYRVLHRDGRWRWFEAMGRTLAPDTAAEGMVANARDITERREAEEELKRQRAYFEEILASIDAGIAVWDPHGRFEYVSPPAIHDDATREWVIGRDLVEYGRRRNVPAELTRIRVESVTEAIRSRQSTEYEETLTRPDGERVHLLRRNRPILDEAGVVERVVGYSVDITHRKRAEEALLRASQDADAAREAAERANNAKSEFLSRMSHELRTPMNSILGFAQLLDRAPLAPEHRKGVAHILKAGRHLLQLINEVLEIARIEAGRHSLSIEPVRAAASLQEAIALVRPLAAQYRVEIDEDRWSAGALYVRADRQRLTQVLLNVLGNAIKYNRAGGRVRVGCEAIGEGDLGRLAIRVQDTGRGIPEDQRDELFTPFARLGAERSDVEGTGLGLALSHRLMEAMSGSLLLERSGPEGSVFRLELPLASDPVAALEGPAPDREPASVPHGPATLLYIEDNLANLTLVEAILVDRPNWRTVPALQGLVGLELAREHAPDLILLDLHLPDIHGGEVLQRLRADPRTAHIPVVVISADATRAALERLRTLGADAYLTKPLDVDEFLQTVERFLRPPRAEGAGAANV